MFHRRHHRAFLPHTEYYVCITSAHEGKSSILFIHEGGVGIDDVDTKAFKLDIPVDAPFPPASRDESFMDSPRKTVRSSIVPV